MNDELLSKILLDTNEVLDLRDDAAMDLAEFDSKIAYDSLVTIATNDLEDEVLQNSAGESLGEIWVRQKKMDFDTLGKLTYLAKREAIGYVRAVEPSLLDYEKLI